LGHFTFLPANSGLTFSLSHRRYERILRKAPHHLKAAVARFEVLADRLGLGGRELAREHAFVSRNVETVVGAHDDASLANGVLHE